MRRYIRKCMTIWGLSIVLLFSLYGCSTSDTTADDEEEVEQVDDEEEIEEETNEIVSGTYTPESNKFEIQLPNGNWKVDREEDGMASLQSEDEQSYFEIAYLSAEDAEGALGETPSSREELEEQISYGEVHPTVVSFDTKTEEGVEQTVYTLKYEDGDYPYMIQGSFVKDGEYFTVIAMTKQNDTALLESLQQAVTQFKILS